MKTEFEEGTQLYEFSEDLPVSVSGTELCSSCSVGVSIAPTQSQSISNSFTMLTSLACGWRSVRVAPKSSSGLKAVKSGGKSNIRSRSLPLTSVSRRNYAMMYYTDPFVAPAYDKFVLAPFLS